MGITKDSILYYENNEENINSSIFIFYEKIKWNKKYDIALDNFSGHKTNELLI